MDRLFEAEVRVEIKPEILDPQGKAVEQALHHLGVTRASSVRVGKLIRFHLEAPNEAEAQKQVRQMCEQLLANPIIETYSVQIRNGAKKAAP